MVLFFLLLLFFFVFVFLFLFFFFQAEDGIRDSPVTGVQTCALPIFQFATGDYVLVAAYGNSMHVSKPTKLTVTWQGPYQVVGSQQSPFMYMVQLVGVEAPTAKEIGRASCRERV